MLVYEIVYVSSILPPSVLDAEVFLNERDETTTLGLVIEIYWPFPSLIRSEPVATSNNVGSFAASCVFTDKNADDEPEILGVFMLFALRIV